MRKKTTVVAALVLAAVSGNAFAANKWDPWAYCWAQTKGRTKFIFSAPTQIAGSDYTGIADAWKAFATERLGATLDRAECRWAYTQEAAPQALQMAVDEQNAAGRPVDMTGWIWAP